MSRTDALADPLISSFAALLTVPLRELYALLWRVGVVEIVECETAPGAMRLACSCRAAEGSVVPVAHHDYPEYGPPQPSRRSRPRQLPGPAPTRPGRSGYNRAVG
ncbi:Rv1535 domain-containing protein [Mycobacterium basiliense]|uniref:Rv1535 domain-containing protein n=1 Tax=Mycobacterium basiliense TaxID=2094119 RepID=UPI0022B26210|nr:Rv1535 domain-containing protein [Mycobacterium basiliense]